MASGKSKIGKKIANYLNMDFIDFDEVLIKLEGLSINEIFELKGEQYFRELETNLLSQNKYKNSIISLGGGTACYNNNIDYIIANGFTIYFKLPIKIIIGRLKQDKANRPLVKNLNDKELNNTVTNLFEKRKQFYEKANLVIDSQMSFNKIKRQIETEFKKYNL